MNSHSELPIHSFRSMGGLATVTAGVSYSGAIDSLTAQVRGIFEDLERELSAYRSDSVTSRLAEFAGASPLPLSDGVWRVLNLGLQYGELSNGAFDVSVAPLVRLWGFGRASTSISLPLEEAIQEQVRLVDYRRVILKEQTAFLPVKGMGIDLGGIAKGYAVDRAFDLCRRMNVKHFLIDLSGNIRVSGRPQWGRDWQIGVRHPFDRSLIMGKITLRSGMALATSGSYERFVEIAGRRFSHIIDPRSGYPVTGTASVTILAENATTADGLSTPFFVEGLKGAGKLLQKTAPADVLIVPDKFPIQIWLTPGFAEVFVPIPELSSAVRILNLPSPDRQPGTEDV